MWTWSTSGLLNVVSDTELRWQNSENKNIEDHTQTLNEHNIKQMWLSYIGINKKNGVYVCQIIYVFSHH
jgi:hypothetical protein